MPLSSSSCRAISTDILDPLSLPLPSSIASGTSSVLLPVSARSCSMYVLAGRPTFARPCEGVHRSTSLMRSSLLLQKCPACLVGMCFNQRVDITTLSSSSLKLVDKFTCLGSSVSSTEKDINTQRAKSWTAIDRISVIWKSDLTDKIKHGFFHATEEYWYCYMYAVHGLSLNVKLVGN